MKNDFSLKFIYFITTQFVRFILQYSESAMNSESNYVCLLDCVIISRFSICPSVKKPRFWPADSLKLSFT
jgi:hypothetical protein